MCGKLTGRHHDSVVGDVINEDWVSNANMRLKADKAKIAKGKGKGKQAEMRPANRSSTATSSGSRVVK